MRIIIAGCRRVAQTFEGTHSLSASAAHGLPSADGIDEVLIVLLVGASGHEKGLPACFSRELARVYVWHPNLSQPHAVLAKLLAAALSLVHGLF